MHSTSYQPSRRQHLALAKMVRERYGIDEGNVIVHYVLMDTPLRLYVQVEIHRNTVYGKVISFDRLEL
jgi:hypothetical protein